MANDEIGQLALPVKYGAIISAHEAICNEPDCAAAGHYARADKEKQELVGQLEELRAEVRDLLTERTKFLNERVALRRDLQFAQDDLKRLDGACWYCLNPDIEDPWRHDHGDGVFHWHHCIDPGDGLPSACDNSDMLERLYRGLPDELGTNFAELHAAKEKELASLRSDRVAILTAHRVCTGSEHNPANGKIHGYCVVCAEPWPCDYAKDGLVEELASLRASHDLYISENRKVVLIQVERITALEAELASLREQLANEISDVEMLDRHASHVFCHVTGGKISKPNTLPEIVCSVADDHQQDTFREWFEDESEPLKQRIAALEEALQTLNIAAEQYRKYHYIAPTLPVEEAAAMEMTLIEARNKANELLHPVSMSVPKEKES